MAFVTAIVWSVMTAWCLLGAGPVGLLPLLLPLTCMCCALGLIDAKWHRLPNALVYPLYPLVLVGLFVGERLSGESAWLGAAVGAGLWGGVLLVIHVVSAGRGMGMGDVKLAPIVGAVLGWVGIEAAVMGLTVAFGLGGIWAVGALVAGRSARSSIAFGPFLLIGGAVGLGIAVGAPELG